MATSSPLMAAHRRHLVQGVAPAPPGTTARNLQRSSRACRARAVTKHQSGL